MDCERGRTIQENDDGRQELTLPECWPGMILER